MQINSEKVSVRSMASMSELFLELTSSKYKSHQERGSMLIPCKGSSRGPKAQFENVCWTNGSVPGGTGKSVGVWSLHRKSGAHCPQKSTYHHMSHPHYNSHLSFQGLKDNPN